MPRRQVVFGCCFLTLVASCGSTTEDTGSSVADAASDAATDADAASMGGTGGAQSVELECTGSEAIPSPSVTCTKIEPGSFGACAAVLGVGFDGNSCVSVSGCAAPPRTLFASVAECAVTCAAAGQCDPNDIGSKVDVNTHCDSIEVRLPVFDDSKLEALCAIAPELSCSDQPDKPVTCILNTEHGPGLTPEQVLDVCAFGLVPDVDELFCNVWL